MFYFHFLINFFQILAVPVSIGNLLVMDAHNTDAVRAFVLDQQGQSIVKS